MADHPIRFELDVEAASLQDLEDKLLDLATDIARGQFSPKAVFASPSCRGHYETTHRGSREVPGE